MTADEFCRGVYHNICTVLDGSDKVRCAEGVVDNERQTVLVSDLGAYTVLTLKNSFHGRTLTTLAATGQDVFHTDFTPLTPGFVYAEPNDLADVRRLCDGHKIAAFLIEIVQGEGGVTALDPDFVTGLAELARERDILLMCDEVQCGNGRSGSLYAYMQYGISPDVVSTAKGLGGGLPLGATLMGERVADILTPGSHGSTFGGNPVACAGALNILSRLDDAMLAGVRERSRMIFSAFEGAKGVKSVSGLGLMIGIETVGDAGAILAAARERGVLAIKAKNKVRLLPPLNIPTDDLQEAITVLLEVIAENA